MTLPSPHHPLLFPHQRPAYDQLLATAHVCLGQDRHFLPFQPRTNTLIIGPTGSGKTHLARAVADELRVPFLDLVTPEWILLGATERAAQTTWVAIVETLLSQDTCHGLVIFLDEIDKLLGNTSWDIHLRTEVFRLLDGRIPPHLKDADGDPITAQTRAEAEAILKRRTCIIAAGAFQDVWEQQATTRIGFGDCQSRSEEPDHTILANRISRELLNRFRSNLIILQPLQLSHYQSMIDKVQESLDMPMAARFQALATKKLQAGIAHRLGARFVEEVLMELLVEDQLIAGHIEQQSLQL